MHLQEQESSAGIAIEQQSRKSAAAILDAKASAPDFQKASSSLPFGQIVPLSAVSGPTYVTAQLLVQQVAYKLSDKIFSYSPESFDLDVAAKEWSSNKEDNVHGYAATLVPLETRTGAGAFALGYIFSKDFDLTKRHIPQSLLASSLSLNHLRFSLDQLSLFYDVAGPFVAHIAAVDYSDEDGLVVDYSSTLRTAEELGFGLVCSASVHETQHVSMFATLMATILPAIHVYDGLRTSRETSRVMDAMNESRIAEIYTTLTKAATAINPRLDDAGKVLDLLQAFNSELGTAYQPFEYHGHLQAETVFVVFGSVEAQLACQVAAHLVTNAVKVGVVNVRIYRPFVEEAFLASIPKSVKRIAVLGQVPGEAALSDISIHSVLYADVLAAASFSSRLHHLSVLDVKYPASQVLTPQNLCQTISKVALGEEAYSDVNVVRPDNALQLSFWDVDNSVASGSPSVLSHIFSRQSSANVSFHETHDNLLLGGIVRTDIRVTNKTVQAPYPIRDADVAFVGQEKLLEELQVLNNIKNHGLLILKLPKFSGEDVEKRIPVAARKEMQQKRISVFVFDPALLPLSCNEKAITELALMKTARPEIAVEEYSHLILAGDSAPRLADAIDMVEKCLRQIEVPGSWATLLEDLDVSPLPAVKNTSFVAFDKKETEQIPEFTNWEAVAKALAFKEVYGTKESLRPDLTVKTSTVTVYENRRLTPETYDRNIFHIEFDLGDSGLTYQIGEALGIHAENDPAEVEEFISWYGLDASAVVQVPSRESSSVVETRTVYQALVQNIDLFGKPPRRFYEALSEHATDESEKQKLADLGSAAGAEEFKKRGEVYNVTFTDILAEFKSAHPDFHGLTRLVGPLKRREYSIASAQAVTPNSVSLMIVVVDWTDGFGRKRMGHATRYLKDLPVGSQVTVSMKPSVMKLPASDTSPLIMAGLGTGLAPFRAFVQHRAMQKAAGKEIGAILLYMGSRHQREEYLYGEEWEAYLSAGVVTLLSAAFSRDQPHKIYIQDRMRQTMDQIIQAYVKDRGSFYLCGPTWPVPDVTAVLEEAIAKDAKDTGRKIDPRKEIEKLKEEGRYVLEVY